MDTVDNSGRVNKERPKGVPDDGRRSPGERTPGLVAAESGDVPTPSDTQGRRGADLAREALRAAREVAAERRGRRAAPRSELPGNATGTGSRRRWSGPGPDERDPQPFGRLIARIVKDRGWSDRLTDATVLARWPQLVGPEIADHCTPVSLRDGELVLQAESTAWATQLRTLQRRLLTRLAEAVGHDVVRRIRVVGPTGTNWRHGPRSVRGRGPRDTYG